MGRITFLYNQRNCSCLCHRCDRSRTTSVSVCGGSTSFFFFCVHLLLLLLLAVTICFFPSPLLSLPFQKGDFSSDVLGLAWRCVLENRFGALAQISDALVGPQHMNCSAAATMRLDGSWDASSATLTINQGRLAVFANGSSCAYADMNINVHPWAMARRVVEAHDAGPATTAYPDTAATSMQIIANAVDFTNAVVVVDFGVEKVADGAEGAMHSNEATAAKDYAMYARVRLQVEFRNCRFLLAREGPSSSSSTSLLSRNSITFRGVPPLSTTIILTQCKFAMDEASVKAVSSSSAATALPIEFWAFVTCDQFWIASSVGITLPSTVNKADAMSTFAAARSYFIVSNSEFGLRAMGSLYSNTMAAVAFANGCRAVNASLQVARSTVYFDAEPAFSSLTEWGTAANPLRICWCGVYASDLTATTSGDFTSSINGFTFNLNEAYGMAHVALRFAAMVVDSAQFSSSAIFLDRGNEFIFITLHLVNHYQQRNTSFLSPPSLSSAPPTTTFSAFTLSQAAVMLSGVTLEGEAQANIDQSIHDVTVEVAMFLSNASRFGFIFMEDVNAIKDTVSVLYCPSPLTSKEG